MPTPIGTLEFFALEAGEYLERLAQLAAKPGGPAADELVRYARALRGSALMANQQPMSRAAGGLSRAQATSTVAVGQKRDGKYARSPHI